MRDLLTAVISVMKPDARPARGEENGLHAAVVPSGHAFARMAAGAGLSLPTWRDEQWHGRTQLRFVSRMAEEFHEKPSELQEKLACLRSLVFCRDRLLINLTGDEEGLSMLSEHIKPLVNRLTTGVKEQPGNLRGKKSVYAGITIPAQVSYVARVMTAPNFKHPLSPVLLVLARHLSNGYLYKHIRVQGGAYGGCACSIPQAVCFPSCLIGIPASWRPWRFIRRPWPSLPRKTGPEEMEKAIIGTIGGLDRPLDPSSRGTVAMMRELAGITDDDRRRFREAILDASTGSLQEAAIEYFERMKKDEGIAVYASEDSLSAANARLHGNWILSPRLESCRRRRSMR
jgi:Zn-dependent M16 (insulinase) family peptidase